MAYRKIPSLNWLRVFEAAAQTESFSAAANILNMSPSAVSQQISTLEHHLGEKLFTRGPKSVRLTENGLLFLPTVRDALSSLETGAAQVFGLDQDEHLIVEANTIFATSWLAPRLPAFEALYPNVNLNIACVDQFTNTGHDQADVIISFGPTAWDKGETTPLFSESIYPVASTELASQITHPEDLTQHRLIDVTGHRQTWRLMLGTMGLNPETRHPYSFVSNSNLAFCLAAAGSGIALARAPATDWLVNTHGLVRCLPDQEVRGEGSYILAANRRNGTTPVPIFRP